MRVLVVEDKAPIREQIASDLKKNGFTVDVASDGAQGLYIATE